MKLEINSALRNI